MNDLTHIDLFSGIGGFSLAAEWAGFRTVCFCEIDDYCQAVLKKHWPGVPIWDDIKTFKWPLADSIGPRLEGHGESIQRTRELPIREGCAITLLTGGFPCQPFSCVGKRRGKADDRFLWPEMFRVISEVGPAWVLAENVAGIVKMELDRCLSDLETEGYETETFVIPACAVDAKHRRDRVWIVGHSSRARRQQISRGTHEDEGTNEGWPEIQADQSSGSSQDVADGTINELSRCRRTRSGRSEPSDFCRWPVEPDVGLLVDGLPPRLAGWCVWPEEPKEVPRVAKRVEERVNRLKALGNSIVPQVAYEIIRAIAEIEKEN